VEAVTGKSADRHLRSEKEMLEKVQSLLGNQQDPLKSLDQLLHQKKELEKEVKKLKQQKAAGRLDDILESAKNLNGIQLYSGEISGGSMDQLKQMGYDSLNRLKESSVVLLGTVNKDEQKVYLLAAVTDDLIKKGIKAGEIVSAMGREVGGGGGGQPNLATAGGRHPEKMERAFQVAESRIKEKVN
jgi:alanyl-tRNA synthetase